MCNKMKTIQYPSSDSNFWVFSLSRVAWCTFLFRWRVASRSPLAKLTKSDSYSDSDDGHHLNEKNVAISTSHALHPTSFCSAALAAFPASLRHQIQPPCIPLPASQVHLEWRTSEPAGYRHRKCCTWTWPACRRGDYRLKSTKEPIFEQEEHQCWNTSCCNGSCGGRSGRVLQELSRKR